jgi:hypothetical protein
MSYILQYNWQGNPIKSRIFTDDWNWTQREMNRLADDPHAANIQLFEAHEIMAFGMELPEAVIPGRQILELS